jgi:hypothetical protein
MTLIAAIPTPVARLAIIVGAAGPCVARNPTALAVQEPDQPMVIGQQHQGRKATGHRKGHKGCDANRHENGVVKHATALTLGRVHAENTNKGAKP